MKPAGQRRVVSSTRRTRSHTPTSKPMAGVKPGRCGLEDFGIGWCGSAPNSEALQTALALAEARAFFDGPRREVYTRVGGSNGKIYIDLANEHWQAIEISSTGWQVLDSKQVLVRFRRAPGMLPLPEPRTGGSVDDLRLFLNVKSDDDFELALAWLLAAMRDRGPYPV